LLELIGNPDPAISQSVMQAMMKMKKIDIAAIREAAHG
jgi:predicted 3-demethylubiquinone-9 3-methyltransferase (glyoxalase superfamily)